MMEKEDLALSLGLNTSTNYFPPRLSLMAPSSSPSWPMSSHRLLGPSGTVSALFIFDSVDLMLPFSLLLKSIGKQ